MTPDEYFAYLKLIRDQYGKNIGIDWRKHHLRPSRDFENELVGWRLKWVGIFADQHFLRLKETWLESESIIRRSFFTFHYGPYENHWNLEDVEAHAVITRIDSQSYFGRGYHIHDRHKEKRIYQDKLQKPILADVKPIDFIKSVQRIRQGASVTEAFGLEFLT